jgi:hypothetical protein
VSGLTDSGLLSTNSRQQHYYTRSCFAQKGTRVRKFLWLLAVAAVLQCKLVQADTYKCVGADGSITYSDKVCELRQEPPGAQTAAGPPGGLGAARGVRVVSGGEAIPVSSFERKIHELLLLTQFSSREYPGLAEVAHDLVPRVDPNLVTTPRDARWTPLSRLIQNDIRADMPQLGHAFAEADQALVRSLTSQMRESDADALISFFRSPTGVGYLQFLGDMRATYATAVRSVLGHLAAQTPISQSGASAAVMNSRQRLITLAMSAASLYHAQDDAHHEHDPSPYAADGLTPEQIVAVAGPGLDEIAARYEAALPEFETFTASSPMKLFRSTVGRPVTTKAVATEAAMHDFNEAEMEKFGTRWKTAYQRGIYLAVATGPDLTVEGTVPTIRHASYMSPRTGRAFDVTHVLQTACLRGSGGCRIACSNQLAGDPDFGRVKYCQISFQCSGRSLQNLTVSEGRSVTLTCAQ